MSLVKITKIITKTKIQNKGSLPDIDIIEKSNNFLTTSEHVNIVIILSFSF